MTVIWKKQYKFADMGLGIEKWTKQNLWKTAFKKFEVVSSA